MSLCLACPDTATAGMGTRAWEGPTAASGTRADRFRQEILLSWPLNEVVRFLSHQAVGFIRTAGVAFREETAPLWTSACHSAFREAVKDPCARCHYQDLLGSTDEATLLRRRKSLLDIDNLTQLDQWRTHTAVARLMNNVPLDGRDLFAALKRVFLASQIKELEESPCVILWMHVLGAVEEQDPVQSKRLAAEAFEALASSITLENIHWPVQAAHFVDAMTVVDEWLPAASGGPSLSDLADWLHTLMERMQDEPSLGRYGPAGDTMQLRPRHLQQLVTRLKRHVRMCQGAR
ncbi:unnamed protein product [Polarella glacialis]|uniref:Uncharacterized protein n=1 Tax=Polarella glacialis TaxID=89957 RepID=A0A813L2C8_POLGL|nr:unnamed protein product [Polarella glacialis]